ncbi:UNVERIFIED_CONTAM: hypothetical protein Sradi_4759300 [Sesamum radiatum]|uniref:Uncharacterized protein n=1 Tax=Sesamum radiatum TaxID=300843 RepID=A0AAW2MVD3_SESRA
MTCRTKSLGVGGRSRVVLLLAKVPGRSVSPQLGRGRGMLVLVEACLLDLVVVEASWSRSRYVSSAWSRSRHVCCDRGMSPRHGRGQGTLDLVNVVEVPGRGYLL